MFNGRKILIVTRHAKERVIAPLLEKRLRVQCVVAQAFDTDLLGTFSGEVKRTADVKETLRQKCMGGMQLYGYDLAIASEGSFGPHPTVFFAPADEEAVMLVDSQNGLEISARELSLDTNFAAETVFNLQQLESFAALAKFPTHGLIIKAREGCYENMVKGIIEPDELYAVAAQYLERFGSFYVETDMRAMHNPSRMQVIAKATEKLIQRVLNECPFCKAPGFGVTAALPGLPCSVCHLPTNTTLKHLRSCLKCYYTEEVLHPAGKDYEDPMYCNYCNP